MFVVCQVGPTCDYMTGPTLKDGANLLAPPSRRCRRALLFLLLYIECVPMISRRFAITAQSGSKAASKCCSYFCGFHFFRTLASWNAAGWYVLFQAPMLGAWPMDGPGIFLEIPSVCHRRFKTQEFFPSCAHLPSPIWARGSKRRQN